MNQNCGGVWVYFHGLDPDSGVKWDDNGTEGNDNVDETRSVSPDAAVGVPGQSPTDPALAESTLTFTDHSAGDNYRVSGTPFSDPHDSAAYTGVLEAWKVVYYELDKMPTCGSPLAEHASEASSTIAVTQISWLGSVGPGTEVILYDQGNHDIDDPFLHYHVQAVNGNEITLTPALRQDFAGPSGSVPGGAVMAAGSGYYGSIDFEKMEDAYNTQCIRFAQLPEAMCGVVPKYAAKVFPADGYFDHRDIPNVVELIGAWWGGPQDSDLCGLTESNGGRRVLVCRQYDDPPTNFGDLTMQGTLVHEFGHVFGEYDLKDGHPGHRNWSDNDGCVMIYGATPPNEGWNDSDTLPDGWPERFGGPPPQQGQEGSAWYVDLQNIAKRHDPL